MPDIMWVRPEKTIWVKPDKAPTPLFPIRYDGDWLDLNGVPFELFTWYAKPWQIDPKSSWSHYATIQIEEAIKGRWMVVAHSQETLEDGTQRWAFHIPRYSRGIAGPDARQQKFIELPANEDVTPYLVSWAEENLPISEAELFGEAMKKNPLPIAAVVTAAVMELLPYVVDKSNDELLRFQRANESEKIKIVKGWSKWSPVLWVAMKNKRVAKQITKTVAAVVNDPSKLERIVKAGKAAHRVGKAAKGKAPRRISAKKNPRKGHKMLYHIGKTKPIPRPWSGHITGGPWQSHDDMVEGVWLSPTYLDVAHFHHKKGNVYAYEVPVGVIHKAGRARRFEHATEVFIPASLWTAVKFAGKKMDAATLREANRKMELERGHLSLSMREEANMTAKDRKAYRRLTREQHPASKLTRQKRRKFKGLGWGAVPRTNSTISAKRNTREVNPYSKRYTLASFTEKYFPREEVSPGVAKSFWDDFRFGYQGGLGRYIKETTWVDGEQLAKKNTDSWGRPDWRPRGNNEFWVIREWDGSQSRVTAVIQKDGVTLLYSEPNTPNNTFVSHAYFDSIKIGEFDPNVITTGNRRNPLAAKGKTQMRRITAKKNPKKGGEWYSNFSEEELRYEIEDLEEKLADSYRAASRRGPDRLDWSHAPFYGSLRTDLADLRRELKWQEAKKNPYSNSPFREELRRENEDRDTEELNLILSTKTGFLEVDDFDSLSTEDLNDLASTLEEHYHHLNYMDRPMNKEDEKFIRDARRIWKAVSLRREGKTEEAPLEIDMSTTPRSRKLRAKKLMSSAAGPTSRGAKGKARRRKRSARKPKRAWQNGMTRDRPHYPFAEKEEQYRRYTTDQLKHGLKDAMAASKAQQDWDVAGANWYLDDCHTIIKEIQRRKAKRNSPREGKITLYEGQLWTGSGRSYWSVSLEPHGRYAQMREFTREIVVPLRLAELVEAAKGDTKALNTVRRRLREEGYIER